MQMLVGHIREAMEEVDNRIIIVRVAEVFPVVEVVQIISAAEEVIVVE